MAKRSPPMNPAMLDAVAGQFRALAEPARLQLIQLLMEGERSVGELVTASGLSQANVSKHLATLANSGFLSRRKVGTTVIYAIADDLVHELCGLMCKRVTTQAQAGIKALEAPRRR